MKYYYTIHEDNLNDLGNENNGFLKSGKESNDLITTEIKSKLCCMNSKHRNLRDFCFAEWGGMCTDDLVIKGSLLTEPLFGLNIIMEGIWGMKIGNTNNVCKAGTNFFWGTDRESYNSICAKKGNSFSSVNIIFHKHYLESISDKYPRCFSDVCKRFANGETKGFIDKNRQTIPEIVHILSQIKNAHLMGNASDVYTEAKILELLAFQMQQGGNIQIYNTQNQCKSISDIEKIHEAGRLLIANLNQSPTIPELSKHVGVNECKLKYGFKEVYSRTIHQYLFEHKMNLARQLLIDTSYTIFEIAYQCGYDEPSHFSNAFKRRYGMYPREFRNKA